MVTAKEILRGWLEKEIEFRKDAIMRSQRKLIEAEKMLRALDELEGHLAEALDKLEAMESGSGSESG